MASEMKFDKDDYLIPTKNKPIPCGEAVVSFLDKFNITQADLTTSQLSNLVKIICGDKADQTKIIESVRSRSKTK